MFEVGDIVEAIDKNQYSFNSRQIKISSIDSSNYTFRSDDSRYNNYNYRMEDFKLVARSKAYLPLYSDQDAINWLKQKGYKIEPPKSSKIYVCENSTFGHSAIMEDLWESLPENKEEIYKVLAIVDWVEGQGV